jgi:hypothetical protein
MNENKMIFEIAGANYKELRTFQKEHKECWKKNHGFTVAPYLYSFIPNEFGMLINVECSCGEEITLDDEMA